MIRGLNPYPAAWTFIKDGDNEWNVKLYDCEFEAAQHNFTPGQLLTTKKELKVATKDGFIKVNSLQFPGKKKMQTHELLNGIQFSDSTLAF